MRKVPILILSMFVTLFSCSDSGNYNSLSNQEEKDGWELLFDGETLNGWKGFNNESIPEGWGVKDGLLYTTGEGGDLGGDIISEEMYEDFELYLEWAISDGGNSGVMFHVLEGDYPATYATGPEYQLIDDEGFPQKLEEWQKAGADYAMHNADNTTKKLKPAGEFNTSRIRVKEGHVTYWLNGEIIVEYDLWDEDWFSRVENSKWNDYPGYGMARKGHIALQDHGDEVFFRNIKIRDLTDFGQPLFNKNDLEGWMIHGEGNWYAEDGILIGANPEGGAYSYLGTKRNYKDFLLWIDFKFEGYGNSGVFFRSQLDGVDIVGWQAEVAPPGEDSGGIYESGGRGWLQNIPEEREHILLDGEWNSMVLRVIGGQVITWLNNEMMVCLTDEEIANGEGVIALQLHSGTEVKVNWRNIFIKEY